jgi:hypothetical protein
VPNEIGGGFVGLSACFNAKTEPDVNKRTPRRSSSRTGMGHAVHATNRADRATLALESAARLV